MLESRRIKLAARISFYVPTILNLQVLLLVTLFAIHLAMPGLLSADHLEHYEDHTGESENHESPDNIPQLNWYGVDRVDKTHAYLSSTVEKLSQRIDTFFGEDRVYEEATGTYLQARTSIVLGEGGHLDYDFKFRAKLRLPQLKSRFRLIFENEDQQGVSDDFNRDSTDSNVIDELESQDLAASLQYIFRQTRLLNISLRPGIKLSDPVEAFMRLRLSRTVQLTDRWLSRGTGEVGYFTEDGWRNDWRLDFERRAGRRDLFRSSSIAGWREDSPGNWFLTQTFLFTRILDPRSSIAYAVGISAESRPTLHNTSYFSNVRYRRDIHRGWLFMEIRPRVTFAKENGYDEDVSLLITLEALLGQAYSH